MKITKNELNRIILEEINLFQETDAVSDPGVESFFNELRDPKFRFYVEKMDPSERVSTIRHIKKIIELASDEDVMISVGTVGVFFGRLDRAIDQMLEFERKKDLRMGKKEEPKKPEKKKEKPEKKKEEPKKPEKKKEKETGFLSKPSKALSEEIEII